MKYLVLFAVALGAIWWLRQQRPNRDASHPAPPPADAEPEPMVSCSHCGLHLPRHEAVSGDRGLYCCAEHRRRHEG